MTDLVSTIIPVYNRPTMLCEAVKSVLVQTHRPIEVIIVDDGSTDDTGPVADELATKSPGLIRVLHITNGGPGFAREAGRQAARGEFIQYLDSDDILMPEKFKVQVEGLRKHPECGVSYGRTRYHTIGEDPQDIPLKRTGEKIDEMFPAFLMSRWWSTSTPLFRRTVTDAAGPWTNLCNEEDWEYDCRVAALGVKLHYCDIFVSDTRNHPQGRLNTGGTTDPFKLKGRAKAHILIYRHALKAGIAADAPEMQHFARELFLLSRQCGEAGLVAESKRLFDLARAASTPENANGIDFLLYAAAARVLGWEKAGRLAQGMDRMRNIRQGGAKRS